MLFVYCNCEIERLGNTIPGPEAVVSPTGQVPPSRIPRNGKSGISAYRFVPPTLTPVA